MTAFFYFGILILIVMIGFTVFRRPMYEVIPAAFLLLTIVTGSLPHIFRYMSAAADTYLLYTIAAFICFSVIFEKTGVIRDLINIIMAAVGRFSGGAGYVALAASAAMGALSGTGPGNAAAVGVITIPTMKERILCGTRCNSGDGGKFVRTSHSSFGGHNRSLRCARCFFAGHLHFFTILALCMGHFILVYSASPGDALFPDKKISCEACSKRGQNNSEGCA